MKRTDYLKALKYNEEIIIEDLIVTDVIPDLRTCKLFTLDDEEIVLHQVTSKAKNVKLLDIIRSKDDELFEKFCDILRTTNEEIAESLVGQNYVRVRRTSHTDFGEILIKGGVPDRSADYVPRQGIEKKVLNMLKSNSKKPILVHGVIGCGKTSIVSNLLYSNELFPDRFLKCCWMNIGNIKEEDVNNKLSILLKKLNPSAEIPMNNISEILVDCIKERLYDETTLLILDDIWSADIMKYFLFHNTYIVTSRRSNLFRDNVAEFVQIPDKFEIKECEQLLNYNGISEEMFSQIIDKSHCNPMFLSIICNLINSNSDFSRMIGKIDFDRYLDNVLEEYINILDKDIKCKYEMLAVLQLDETISIDLISIYWDMNPTKGLDITNKLCNLNFLYKNWNNDLGCNMYGVYSIHLKYLQQNNNELQKFQQIFIDRYKKKYKSWLDINHSDPFFLMFYGKSLYSLKNFETLTKLYSDFSFIAAKIAICGIADLQNEYEKYRSPNSNSTWDNFERFFMKWSHKFIKLPPVKDVVLKISKVFRTVIQLGLYETEESATFKLASKIWQLSKWKDFWDWINPKCSIKVWEISHDDNIMNVDVNQSYIIMSSEHGRVRLLEFSSGKCLFNYKLSDSIILVKFLSDHEFIIIDSIGQFWIYNFFSLLPQINEVENNDDDEDFDEIDYQSSSNEIDFNNLREQFQNLLVDDFISKCTTHTINNKKLVSHSLRALLFSETIVFLNVDEKSSYIALYDFQGRLKDDFTVSFPVKKFIPKLSGFYALKEDSGKIAFCDEYGSEESTKNMENQVIIDFTIKEDDIFCAVQNKIYKNYELLFKIDAEANIIKISISDKNSLLALCLTNDSVQIWDHVRKELLYSLNDSQFTDVYFQNDTNYLLTIGQTNVAKWDINNVNLANINNNAQPNSLLLYHKKFGMQNQSSSSFLLVLQTIKNNLEFCTCIDKNINSKIIHEEFEISCLFFSDRYLFISFKTSGDIKIYDLKTYENVQKFGNFKDVNGLSTFRINRDVFGLVVYHSENKITILHLNQENLTKLDEVHKKLPTNTSICEFFRHNEYQITLAIICDKTCSLLIINEAGFTNSYSYELENNILDLDISEENQYLCAISEHGDVKVWEMGTDKFWNSEMENNDILRKCKFRPKKPNYNWNVVAIINDKAIISLFYFRDNKIMINIIIEDYVTKAMQLPQVIKWSTDSNYLLVGDYNIRKWKIPLEPRDKSEVKLPLTNLPTYFGGIHNIHLNDNFICTVDQQGFLYILKKIE